MHDGKASDDGEDRILVPHLPWAEIQARNDETIAQMMTVELPTAVLSIFF